MILSFGEVCKNEYIVPLGPELKELYEDPAMDHSLRCLKAESVRPQMNVTHTFLNYCKKNRKYY
jgi:hypothetical protein